jgi:hypothetical protein
MGLLPPQRFVQDMDDLLRHRAVLSLCPVPESFIKRLWNVFDFDPSHR